MRSDIYISGFMIVRDGVAGGYPFLEAVLAALPVCDEFLVSDGFSTDETWPALHKLQTAFPDKIRLFRDFWPEGYPDGTVIAEVSNLLRRRCQGEYCLYVQANEILHQTSRPLVHALPMARPDVELFALPFDSVMGSDLLWGTDIRHRLFKNRSDIVALGDGFDVGYRSSQPKTGMVMQCQLPRPFYRYRALAPSNYITKLETRLAMFEDPERIFRWRAELEAAQSAFAGCGGQYDLFWDLMRPYLEKSRPVRTATPTGPMKRVTTHPEAAKHLFWHFVYDADASLVYLDSVIDR
jgi:hypothetical protein